MKNPCSSPSQEFSGPGREFPPSPFRENMPDTEVTGSVLKKPCVLGWVWISSWPSPFPPFYNLVLSSGVECGVSSIGFLSSWLWMTVFRGLARISPSLPQSQWETASKLLSHNTVSATLETLWLFFWFYCSVMSFSKFSGILTTLAQPLLSCLMHWLACASSTLPFSWGRDPPLSRGRDPLQKHFPTEHVLVIEEAQGMFFPTGPALYLTVQPQRQSWGRWYSVCLQWPALGAKEEGQWPVCERL